MSNGLLKRHIERELFSESPRVCRRAKYLRGLAHEQTNKIFPRSTRTRSSHGITEGVANIPVYLED